MYEDFFATRVSQLRIAQGVSARDMSLSLGLSESYINKVENGKTFPSMQVFFYICEYFQLTPQQFFEVDAPNPGVLAELLDDLKALDSEQLESMAKIAKGLRK